MTRKRSTTTATANASGGGATIKSTAKIEDSDPQIKPTKLPFILKSSLLIIIPYLYLLFSGEKYEIEYELKRSIIINASVSVLGFVITLKLIPVASKYVLRRNLYGRDINKRGTPQGDVKVPESLGIVVGVVFLVVAILFQYFNFTADSNGKKHWTSEWRVVCKRWSPFMSPLPVFIN